VTHIIVLTPIRARRATSATVSYTVRDSSHISLYIVRNWYTLKSGSSATISHTIRCISYCVIQSSWLLSYITIHSSCLRYTQKRKQHYYLHTIRCIRHCVTHSSWLLVHTHSSWLLYTQKRKQRYYLHTIRRIRHCVTHSSWLLVHTHSSWLIPYLAPQQYTIWISQYSQTSHAASTKRKCVVHSLLLLSYIVRASYDSSWLIHNWWLVRYLATKQYTIWISENVSNLPRGVIEAKVIRFPGEQLFVVPF